MGYVFTPKEFEEGRIPAEWDYKAAVTRLQQGLTELHGKGLVYGANIHGSILHPGSRAGSDVDVFVVLQHQNAVESLRELGSDIRKSTNVPVEFIPRYLDLLKRGLHDLTYFYTMYMKDFCREGVVGNNPIPIIAPKDSWSYPSEEVRDRFVSQLSKFTERKITTSGKYDEEHCRLLERLLRQPIYAAIDMLRLRQGGYPSREGVPLSKGECCEMYMREFQNTITHEDVVDLLLVLEMRKRYREFIEKPQAGASKYQELLEEIDGIYPESRSFIETNLELLHQL